MERLYLSVYLIRDGMLPSDAVNISGLNDSLDISLSNNSIAKLHYGVTKSTPDWFTALASKSLISPNKSPETSSVTGLLIASVKGRFMVATFGHGWQRVDGACVEPNFGLRCVLNLAERTSLKSIKRNRIAENFVQAIEQIPDSDDIYRFGIDIEKDMLKGVKAKVDAKYRFGESVSGADAFKASLDLSTDTIENFLVRCKNTYSKSSYLKSFSWVDNISAVRDIALISNLENELVTQLTRSGTDFCLSIPDIIAWDDFDTFSFKTNKGIPSPVSYELSIVAWLAFAKSAGLKVSSETLKSNQIYAYKQGDTGIKKKWSVMNCIHGSISYKSSIYLLHGGNWFELNKDFVKQVDKKIASIELSTVKLPKVSSLSETEGVYNARVASESKGYFALLDKKLIGHGGGKSRIELCDLFSMDGRLVCVKSWGGNSASLSHLFQQATVAASLICQDVDFNKKAKEKFPKSHQSAWDAVTSINSNPELVLAVMRGPSPTRLPFFARLSLSMCVTQLRQMRFKPTYIAID